MDKTNMDMFNEYAAKIFDRLYAEFPVPINISQSEIVGDSADKELRDIFWGTMRFLEREGYLTHEGSTMGVVTYSMVVLTSMGLAILDATPDSIKGSQEPFIQKIRKGIASGGGEAVKAVIQNLISYSVKAMVE